MRTLFARVFGRNIQKTLERTEGGIYKRIDENRELAELLAREVPALVKEHPSLMIWLKSQDHFLSELAEHPVFKTERCLFKPRKGLPRPFDFDARIGRTRTKEHQRERATDRQVAIELTANKRL